MLLSHTVCNVFELTEYDLAAEMVARTCATVADRGRVLAIDLDGEAMQKSRDFLALVESALDQTFPNNQAANVEAYEKAVEVLEAANPKMDGLTADDELRWYISFLRPHVRQRKLPIEETIMIRRMAEFFRTLHMRARQDRIRLATAAIQ